jgi:ABC-type tungstate transport system permease subunit
MEKIHESSTSETYKATNGTIIGIDKDNSMKNYYSVFVKEPNKEGKTVATRCRYEKAMQIANEYEMQKGQI